MKIPPAKLSSHQINALTYCSAKVERKTMCFEDGYLDYDLDEFYYYLNEIFTSLDLKTRYTIPQDRFSKNDIERLIQLCDCVGQLFT